MKIATFNINNVNKRLSNLLAWLDECRPDIVCLQELKAEQANFPAAQLAASDYRAVWRGQRSWNGVAILARSDQAPVLTQVSLPGDETDDQSRYIEAAVAGLVIASIYLPNGNPHPGPKYDYKMRWFERLIAHADALIAANVPVVLAGDFNVVPTPADIYPTRSFTKDALVQPRTRDAFQRLLAQGWTDTLAAHHAERPPFTFWDYKRDRWPRDAGLRLDHILLSPQLAPRLAAAGVDRAARGRPNASDHAPVWIELADNKASGTARRGKRTPA